LFSVPWIILLLSLLGLMDLNVSLGLGLHAHNDYYFNIMEKLPTLAKAVSQSILTRYSLLPDSPRTLSDIERLAESSTKAHLADIDLYSK